MIAIAAPMQDVQKSNFGKLGRYITSSQNNEERLENIKMTNFQANDIETGILEALATQGQNTRSSSEKNYHLIVSFQAGEYPSKEVLADIENTICNDLGFEGHQRISAVHGDTDHIHLHVAINKVNPNSHKVVTPYRDFKTLAQSCERLEKKHHLLKDNHEPKLTVSQNKANDMERHSGRESFLSWAREHVLEDIKNAKSWEEVHAITKKNKVSLKSRGNGLAFATLDEKNKAIYLKASSVDRALSKKTLEEKLGPFKGDPEEKIRKGGYTGKPKGFGIDPSPLFKEWQELSNKNFAAKTVAMEVNKEEFKKDIAEIRKAGRTRRKLIKMMDLPPAVKRLFYARERKRMQAELKRRQLLRDRKKAEIYQKYKRYQWADWLKKEAENGNYDAIAALRSREKGGIAKNIIEAGGNKLLSFGRAPYEFKEGAKENFYITLESKSGQETTIWGVDFERAIQEGGAEVGDQVKVENLGSQPVTLKGGKIAHRNKWNVIVQNDTPEEEKTEIKNSKLTKRGTIFKKTEGITIKDSGDKISLKMKPGIEAELADFQALILAAKKKYGDVLQINGDAEFKAKVLLATAVFDINVKFNEPSLEKRRQELQEKTQKKSKKKEAVLREAVQDDGVKLLSFGRAPYEFKEGAKENFYITLESKSGQETTIWGVDFERAIQEGGAEVGDQVKVENLGSQPVTLKGGKIAHRNKWNVIVQTINAEVIKNGRERERDREEHTRENRARADRKRLGRGVGYVASGGHARNAEFRRERGRTDSGIGRAGPITARGATYIKSYVKRVGGEPPATRRNHLYALSELNMVRQAGQAGVLLQGNVSNHVGERQARSDQRLRWGISLKGIEKERIAAAIKYIEERNNKKEKGMDIAKHIPYKGERYLIYRGQRNGMFILLENPKNKDEIQVLPVTKEIAEQTKKIKLGTEISINNGHVRRRGNRRK